MNEKKYNPFNGPERPRFTMEQISDTLHAHIADGVQALDAYRQAGAAFVPTSDVIANLRAKLAKLRNEQAAETEKASAAREQWAAELRAHDGDTASVNVREMMREQRYSEELAEELGMMASGVETELERVIEESQDDALRVRMAHEKAIKAAAKAKVSRAMLKLDELAQALAEANELPQFPEFLTGIETFDYTLARDCEKFARETLANMVDACRVGFEWPFGDIPATPDTGAFRTSDIESLSARNFREKGGLKSEAAMAWERAMRKA